MFLVLLTIVSLASIVVRVCGYLHLTKPRVGVLYVVMPLNVFNGHSSIQYLKGTRVLNMRSARRLHSPYSPQI
ncbi:MAG: hypothetical protein HW382_694 [Deltaproteobacteria bacterium]|nr:hypothetical protein [Deltaproteobacteria bacterium]MBM2838507.1 hypothetical protein [Deltaproteobacteria bacterium]